MMHAPWKMTGQLDETVKRMKLMIASTTDLFQTKEPTGDDRKDLSALAEQSEVYAKGLLSELAVAAKTDMRKYRTIKQAIQVQAKYRETLLKILAR